MYRTGIGWDVHTLEEGRRLMLGGVHFEGERLGLLGHSDADVVCHAVCDALLGAASLGDLGDHFPDSDPAYRDFPGGEFVEIVRDKVRNEGYLVVNVDCVVMSDAVRLGDKKKTMAASIAGHLQIDPDRVGVKATTCEGHGAVGRGEVIACQAIALLTRED
ncbi:MAG: 2-C-methyl-D-erythritol 2,4-cyclodiphosphate synthase [Candidatus Krumholzibacteriia bacterium]